MNTSDKILMRKAGEIANSLISISKIAEVNKNSFLLHSLKDISNSVNQTVKEFKTHYSLGSILTKMRLSTELEDARVHLSLLESFGYAKTLDIRLKVDELTKLLKIH